MLLKATGDAPIMKKKKWAVDKTKQVSYLIDFIKKYIKCEPSESLVSLIISCFSSLCELRPEGQKWCYTGGMVGVIIFAIMIIISSLS